MAYQRTPFSAPVLAGTPLRVLAWTLERPWLGAPLRAKLLADAGIPRLRQAEVGDAPALPLPLHRWLPEPSAPPSDNLLGSVPDSTTNPGFRPHTAGDIARAYREGRADPVAIAEAFLAAQADTDTGPRPLRAFIAVQADDLRRQAEASAQRHREGRALGPLDGVPVAVKDEVDQLGYPTTAGTRFMAQGPAAADAAAVARLRAAGALLVGKASMHEIGIGVTGLNPHYGVVRNPCDPGHHTGGSSSGSAAAVASGLVPLALAADGGGSIRIPAGFCGVVGLKATFQRISERGAAPLCWSVGHIGPIGATVRDVALGYAAMAGADPHDPATLDAPPPSLAALVRPDLKGIKIGIYRPWFEDAAPEMVAACRRGLDWLVEAGAVLVDIDLGDVEALRLAHTVTIASEMLAGQRPWYDAHRGDYGLDVRVNLALAHDFGAADLVHAQRVRQAGYRTFQAAFAQVDLIATPNTAIPAPPIVEANLPQGQSDIAQLLDIMRFATQANLLGLPGISFPVGYNAAGLPFALQLMGRPWSEDLLLRAAQAAEDRLERRQPAVWRPLLSA